MLTDVPHGVVRRARGGRVQREREEAAVRALAPLQVLVDLHVVLRDLVRGEGLDVRAEGGPGCDGRASELDANRALPGDGVVAAWKRE